MRRTTAKRGVRVLFLAGIGALTMGTVCDMAAGPENLNPASTGAVLPTDYFLTAPLAAPDAGPPEGGEAVFAPPSSFPGGGTTPLPPCSSLPPITIGPGPTPPCSNMFLALPVQNPGPPIRPR